MSRHHHHRVSVTRKDYTRRPPTTDCAVLGAQANNLSKVLKQTLAGGGGRDRGRRQERSRVERGGGRQLRC